MKRISSITIIFILFSSMHVISQVPQWVWARGAQCSGGISSGADYINVATDAANNLYVAGSYDGAITLGTYTFVSNDGIYVVKYDSSGNILWAQGPIAAPVEEFGVCADGFGNCYVTGTFGGNVSFGAFTLSGGGIFIVKYDSTGTALWAKSARGTQSEYIRSIAADRVGNVFVTGNFSGTLIIGRDTLISNFNGHVFVAKYDGAGNEKWARSAGGTGGDAGDGVATDATGNIYITGNFSSSMIIFGSDTLISGGGPEMFLVKYDQLGNVLWAKGSSISVGSNGIAVDALQNIYVTGDFQDSAVIFGTDTLTNLNTPLANAFLAKYDSAGTVIWARGTTGTGDEIGRSVSADNYGRVYITGNFTSPTITFDTITLPYPTGTNHPVFLAGYDSSGHALFAKVLPCGNNGQGAISSVAASPSGSVYLGGTYGGAGSSLVVGNDTLVNNTNSYANAFVAKLSYPQIEESASEIKMDKEIGLYPSPSNGHFTISLSKAIDNGTLNIYNVMGESIYSASFTGREKTIKLSDEGIYFIHVIDGSVVWTGKIAVLR